MVRSLVQRSPAECGVSHCDREASERRARLPIGCRAMSRNAKNLLRVIIHIRKAADGLQEPKYAVAGRMYASLLIIKLC
jgi:hypothetical protein